MAKKKEAVTETTEKTMSLSERLKKLDTLCDEVTKSGLAVAGRVEKSEAVKNRLTFKFIPTPLENLNEALGGGFPQGKITVVSGAPDSGKTSLALATIGYNMSKSVDFSCLWIESEESLDIEKSAKLFNIDKNRFYAIAPSRNTAGEGVVNILEAAIQEAKPSIVVINTLKMLIPKTELDKPMEKVSVAEQARFNATLVKKLVTLCAESNTAMVIIQQLTTQIGSYGDPLVLAGGNAIRYNSMIILDLRRCSIQDSDPISKDQGMKVHALIKKNHCVIDRNPYCCVEYFVEYGKGFEQTLTVMQRLVEKGILTKRGAYIDLLDKDGKQQDGWTWFGKTKFKADMEDHPEKFEKLKALLNGQLLDNVSDKEMEEIKEEKAAEEELLK